MVGFVKALCPIHWFPKWVKFTFPPGFATSLAEDIEDQILDRLLKFLHLKSIYLFVNTFFLLIKWENIGILAGELA